MEEEWLGMGEAARRLGVTDRTVRTWADRGILRVYRTPGGTRRIDARSLERLRRGRGNPRRDPWTADEVLELVNALGTALVDVDPDDFNEEQRLVLRSELTSRHGALEALQALRGKLGFSKPDRTSDPRGGEPQSDGTEPVATDPVRIVVTGPVRTAGERDPRLLDFEDFEDFDDADDADDDW